MDSYKAIKYHGRDITLRTKTKDGEDGYGDPTFSTSTKTIKGIFQLSDTGVEMEIQGQTVPVDAEVFVDSDESVNTGEGSTYPAELDINGHTYEVHFSENQGNGVQRLLCNRV